MPLAANAVVALADSKSYMKLSGAADDATVEAMINAVSTLFENYCATKFINQTLTEIVDGSGTDIQIVEFCPINSLTEIIFDIDTDSPDTQDVTDFIFNSKAGLIRALQRPFPEGWQNVQIKYACGHGAAIANMPADLQVAAYKQVEFFYKRDTADFSTTFEEGMIIKAPSEMLSPTVRDMLTPYFRVRL